MAEYVTKEQLIDWFRPYGHFDKPIPFETLVSDLRGMKAADVAPVVRCRDCVNRQNAEVCPMCYEEEISWDDDGYMEMDYVLHDQTEPDGFCHCGEREEGADNGEMDDN